MGGPGFIVVLVIVIVIVVVGAASWWGGPRGGPQGMAVRLRAGPGWWRSSLSLRMLESDCSVPWADFAVPRRVERAVTHPGLGVSASHRLRCSRRGGGESGSRL